MTELTTRWGAKFDTKQNGHDVVFVSGAESAGDTQALCRTCDWHGHMQRAAEWNAPFGDGDRAIDEAWREAYVHVQRRATVQGAES